VLTAFAHTYMQLTMICHLQSVKNISRFHHAVVFHFSWKITLTKYAYSTNISVRNLTECTFNFLVFSMTWS